jgi:hypothetical protein
LRFADPTGLQGEPPGALLGNLAHAIIELDYTFRHPLATPEYTYFLPGGNIGRIDILDYRVILDPERLSVSFKTVFWEIKPESELEDGLSQVKRRQAECNSPSLPCGHQLLIPGTDYGTWIIEVPGLPALLAWQEAPGLILYEWQQYYPYPIQVPIWWPSINPKPVRRPHPARP